jgi:plasmid stability protein
MATITVRNLPDSVVEALKQLAIRHNTSMEQEARRILSRFTLDRKAAMERIEASWGEHKKTISKKEAEQGIKQARTWKRR